MILDTSALVAIFFDEPEAEKFTQLIFAADKCRISVVSRLELTMVWERQAKPEALLQAEAFLQAAGIVEEPVTLAQGALARQAFFSFGRGRHSAKLNFGDCFSYALAKTTREPLLFKGEEFRKTDLTAACQVLGSVEAPNSADSIPHECSRQRWSQHR